MKILRAYKAELKPNNRQITFFNQCAGTARFVFNWGLNHWQKQYEEGGKPSQYGLCTQFNAEKDSFCEWIREIPYAVTESAFANLGLAFKNFFRRVKAGEKPGYPKFKTKSGNKSFQLRDTKVESDRVRLTGIGWIRLKERGYIPLEANRYGVYSTISERAGKWFISVLVEDEIENNTELTDEIVGIDFGIKSLAVTSKGKVFDNPKSYRKAEKKLKRLQREMSRRTKGSNNREKTRKKFAKMHLKVANIRSYALHQISSNVVEENPKKIVIEDLNVKGMVRNHNLAKSIIDSSFGELRRQMEYKADRKDIEVVVVDRFEPTSKRCSKCGNIKTDLKLSDRTYKCENCGLEIDRDLNAAINIAALG